MNTPITMKEMSSQERPYEKCLQYGAQSLSDAELLAVILRTGAVGVTALELARRILGAFKAEQSLLGLHHLRMEDLLGIKGVGKVKAIQIQCIVELSRRIAKEKAREGLVFNNPASIAEYYMEDMRHMEQEELFLMMLNTKSRLLGEVMLSRGTINRSVITPREIFIHALHHHAVSVVLVHNHPSGDPMPSPADISLTRRIRDAGELIGITLLDHVIVGDNRYVSLREQKQL